MLLEHNKATYGSTLQHYFSGDYIGSFLVWNIPQIPPETERMRNF